MRLPAALLFGAKCIARFTRIRPSLRVPVIPTLGLPGAVAAHNNRFGELIQCLLRA